MRKIAIGTLALLMVFGLIGSATAKTTKFQFRTNGRGSAAEWYTESEGVGYYTFILADASDQGTVVAVQTCTIDLATYTPSCWSGMANPSGSVFMMDRTMNTSRLSPVSVELWDDTWTTSKIVTVQANWSGIGATVKSKTNVVSKFGTFQEVYHDRTTLRNATAVAQIDGQAPSGFFNGVMAIYRTADLVLSK